MNQKLKDNILKWSVYVAIVVVLFLILYFWKIHPLSSIPVNQYEPYNSSGNQTNESSVCLFISNESNQTQVNSCSNYSGNETP